VQSRQTLNDHDAKPRFRLSASTKSGLTVMIV
jgi:hypothetical protein